MTKSTQPPAPGPDSQLAYHNQEFLESDEARPIRILAEYLHPLEALREQNVQDTIVFFGSARLREDGPLGRYYTEAQELGRLVTDWSKGLGAPQRHFIVCSGGGGGIMEAANRGAVDSCGRTIGLNIGLPHEQHPNPFITPQLSFEFRYFFMRKLWFSYLARAIVVFPGGFGTLDEFFEIITLSQTRKLARPILILLYGPSYWNEIVNFHALVRHGVISKDDLSLFHFVDSPNEALEALKRLTVESEKKCPALAKSSTIGRGRQV